MLDMLWGVMVGSALGISIGTLIVVAQLQRRVIRCEAVMEYLCGREAARLIAGCVSALADTQQTDDGPHPDVDRPLADDNGPDTVC